METADRPVQEARPIGIYVVVALLVLRVPQLLAGLLPTTGDGIFGWFGDVSFIPPYPVETPVGLVVRVVAVLLLVATVVAIVGMLRRAHWGWTMAIATTGFVLALDLGWWVSGEPRYIGMATSALCVFYLNQRDVRIVFEEAE
jgi:hypothetical protein